MVNHVRTLLINRSGVSRPPLGWYGEEYLDPAYVPAVDTPATAAVRAALFGTLPDELTQNYRAAQYTRLLSATPLGQAYLLDADPRVTHRDGGLIDGPWGFTYKLVSGGGAHPRLAVDRPYVGDDTLGQNYFEADVTTNLGTDTVVVERRRPQPQVSSGAFTIESGTLAQQGPFTMDGAGGVRLTTYTGGSPDTTARWQMSMAARPSRSLPSILERITADGASLEALWGADRDREPYRTFRNLVEQGRSWHRRMTGVLLGLAYRTDAIRREQQ